MDDKMTANGFMSMVRDSLANLSAQVKQVDQDNKKLVADLKKDLNTRLSETEKRLNQKIDSGFHSAPCPAVAAVDSKQGELSNQWARLDERHKALEKDSDETRASLEKRIDFWKNTVLWAGGILVSVGLALLGILIKNGGTAN